MGILIQHHVIPHVSKLHRRIIVAAVASESSDASTVQLGIQVSVSHWSFALILSLHPRLPRDLHDSIEGLFKAIDGVHVFLVVITAPWR